jgi:hypothetical protein
MFARSGQSTIRNCETGVESNSWRAQRVRATNQEFEKREEGPAEATNDITTEMLLESRSQVRQEDADLPFSFGLSFLGERLDMGP